MAWKHDFGEVEGLASKKGNCLKFAIEECFPIIFKLSELRKSFRRFTYMNVRKISGFSWISSKLSLKYFVLVSLYFASVESLKGSKSIPPM